MRKRVALRAIVPIVLAIALIALVVVVVISGLYFILEDNTPTGDVPEELSEDVPEELSEDDILDLIYEPKYLGYNSFSYGSLELPVGVTDDFIPPDIADFSYPVLSYDRVELDDKYIRETTDRFFPGMDIDGMEMSFSEVWSPGVPYIIIEDERCYLHLLPSRAIIYELKNDPSYKEDAIGSYEAAQQLAMDFLAEHGGIPEDIHRVTVSKHTTRIGGDPEKTVVGVYLIKFFRKIGDRPVDRTSACQEIFMEFDAHTKELYYFRWHWPELHEDFILEEIPPLVSILDFYGFNNGGPNIINISGYEIQYLVPYAFHSHKYDSSSEVYFLAPYWAIGTSDGRMYFLGILIPEYTST